MRIISECVCGLTALTAALRVLTFDAPPGTHTRNWYNALADGIRLPNYWCVR